MILSKTALIYEIPPAILSTVSALQQLPQSTLLETFSVSLPVSPVYPENLHLSEREEEGKNSCTVGIVTSKARHVLRIPVLPTDLVKMEVTNFPEIPVGQDGIEVETGDARGKPKAGAGSGFITQMILATSANVHKAYLGLFKRPGMRRLIRWLEVCARVLSARQFISVSSYTRQFGNKLV